VLVDQHELRCGVPPALEELGIQIEITSLAAGDYVVGAGVAIERKSAADLHRSLATCRLWAQLNALRAAAHHPYVLVEGDIDDGPVGVHGIRGALLATLDSGVGLIQASCAVDSALWIARIAARAQRPRSSRVFAHPPPRVRRTRAEVAEAALVAVPGISPMLARALLDHFGSVTAVAAASSKELRAVQGIGRGRAAELMAALQGGDHPVQLGRRAEGAALELHA